MEKEFVIVVGAILVLSGMIIGSNRLQANHEYRMALIKCEAVE